MPLILGPPMESIVRPFVAKPLSAATLRPEPKQDTSEAVLTFTARMPVQVTSIAGLGFKVVWADADRFDEVQRDVEVVRVTNPEDPSQFVDVEDTRSIVFDARGRRSRYTFK